MRINHVIVVIGKRRTGKTTEIIKLLSKSKKKVLIYDVNNEAAYSHYQKINNLDNIKTWTRGIVRYFSPDSSYFISKVNKDFQNGVIVFEDSSGYIDYNIQGELKQLLTKIRHYNIDIIFTFHSIAQVPPILFRMINIIVLFKTHDSNIKDLKKVNNFVKLQTAFEEVQKHPDNFFKKTVVIDA
jgi:hypothetical protein